MYRYLKLAFAVVLLAAFSAAQQKPPAHEAKTASARPEPAPEMALPSEDTVNSFLRASFGYDSSVTWRVVEIKPSEAQGLAEITVLLSNPSGQQTTRFFVTPDGKHAILGDVIPFGAHPYAEVRDKLAKEAGGPSRGPADAPAVIVEFGDLQCPHCKAVQPTIEKLLADEPNTRLVFQNFPLPGHDWSAKAAAYADCVGRSSNDAFWKFVAGTYDQQANLTAGTADEKLTDIADKSGVKGADIAACAAKPETTARVEASVALGRAVDVTGTPTLFLNGRKIGNMEQAPYEVLKKLVEFAAKGN
ncbi:MAG TPA: thioredoxin domain-containing protein [Terriglobales bacterium]|nr:thioredoxin domain-containing protein [Terriglobales bacterium]